MTHSAQRLDTVKKKIDALDALMPAGVSSWHVDPGANRVVVNVVASEPSDIDVEAFLADARRTGRRSVPPSRHAHCRAGMGPAAPE